MIRLYHCRSTRVLFAFLLFSVGQLGIPCSAAMGNQGAIEQIVIQKDPYEIRIRLNHQPEYRIFQIDSREAMIAFKNSAVTADLRMDGSGKPFVKEIVPKKLKGKVAAVVVRTETPMDRIEAAWGKVPHTLVVAMYEKRPSHKTRAGLKEKDRASMAGPVLEEKPAPAEALVPGTARALDKEAVLTSRMEIEKKALPETDIDSFEEAYQGGVDDILRELASDACVEKPGFNLALEAGEKGFWQDGILILNQFIPDDASAGCRAQALLLRAYFYFKTLSPEDEAEQLEAVGQLQEWVNRFPGSPYVPYGMAMIGQTYVKLNNIAEAGGYFKIILGSHQDYKGTPEILFEMAGLDVEKKKIREGIAVYKEILSKYPRSAFYIRTKHELGKALYEVNNFSKALKYFKDVAEEDPRKAYDAPELMLYTGNCYYHTGKTVKAREALGKVYNLFPDIDSNHIVLTRIADTFVDEDQIEKAKAVYHLVTETYPGTDGFVISSIRLAKHLEERVEREAIYNRIIREYPDHPMAKLSRLRIAEIQYKAGEFTKSIDTINELLAESPRALRREASFLKKESLESYFRELDKQNDYPRILKKYEEEKYMVRRLDAPELFLLVGNSYYQGYLYAQSADLLAKAHEDFGKGKKSPDLLVHLGVSLQESGKNDEALKILTEYTLDYPQGKHIADAFRRIGRINGVQKDDQKAISNYKTAFLRSGNDVEKAAILIEHARLRSNKGEYQISAGLLKSAIPLLEKTPGDHDHLYSIAYEFLGEAYMNLGLYGKAADALSTAIHKTENEEARISLSYMLGESYHKGNNLQEAEQAYNFVIAAGDPFWSRLASERLRGLWIDKRINKT